MKNLIVKSTYVAMLIAVFKMYPNSNTLPNYKKIGNQHNQGIYEFCKENPNLKYGANISTSTLLTILCPL